MKTNAQLLDEITAAMADVWLAACDRRVIGTTPEKKHVVLYGFRLIDSMLKGIHTGLRSR